MADTAEPIGSSNATEGTAVPTNQATGRRRAPKKTTSKASPAPHDAASVTATEQSTVAQSIPAPVSENTPAAQPVTTKRAASKRSAKKAASSDVAAHAGKGTAQQDLATPVATTIEAAPPTGETGKRGRRAKTLEATATTPAAPVNQEPPAIVPAAAPVAAEPRKRGRQPKPAADEATVAATVSSQAAPVAQETAPSKTAPSTTVATATPAPIEPTKRGRRPKSAQTMAATVPTVTDQRPVAESVAVISPPVAVEQTIAQDTIAAPADSAPRKRGGRPKSTAPAAVAQPISEAEVVVAQPATPEPPPVSPDMVTAPPAAQPKRGRRAKATAPVVEEVGAASPVAAMESTPVAEATESRQIAPASTPAVDSPAPTEPRKRGRRSKSGESITTVDPASTTQELPDVVPPPVTAAAPVETPVAAAPTPAQPQAREPLRADEAGVAVPANQTQPTPPEPDQRSTATPRNQERRRPDVERAPSRDETKPDRTSSAATPLAPKSSNRQERQAERRTGQDQERGQGQSRDKRQDQGSASRADRRAGPEKEQNRASRTDGSRPQSRQDRDQRGNAKPAETSAASTRGSKNTNNQTTPSTRGNPSRATSRSSATAKKGVDRKSTEKPSTRTLTSNNTARGVSLRADLRKYADESYEASDFVNGVVVILAAGGGQTLRDLVIAVMGGRTAVGGMMSEAATERLLDKLTKDYRKCKVSERKAIRAIINWSSGLAQTDKAVEGQLLTSILSQNEPAAPASEPAAPDPAPQDLDRQQSPLMRRHANRKRLS